MTTNSKNPELDFKPEVLGRLDGVLTYNSLDKSVMSDLVQKQISLLEKRVKGQKFELQFTDKAIQHLADVGYDETYGARPLASVFNRLVIRPISKMVLAGKLEEKKVTVDFDGEKLEATVN